MDGRRRRRLVVGRSAVELIRARRRVVGRLLLTVLRWSALLELVENWGLGYRVMLIRGPILSQGPRHGVGGGASAKSIGSRGRLELRLEGSFEAKRSESARAQVRRSGSRTRARRRRRDETGCERRGWGGGSGVVGIVPKLALLLLAVLLVGVGEWRRGATLSSVLVLDGAGVVRVEGGLGWRSRLSPLALEVGRRARVECVVLSVENHAVDLVRRCAAGGRASVDGRSSALGIGGGR